MPTVPSPPAMRGRVDGHVRQLAAFWMGYSVIRLLTGGFFASLFPRFPGGFLNPRFPFPYFGGMMRGIGAAMAVWAILGLLAGWGLLERQPWARMLALVLAFFALLPIGVGTALGIYTLWVLMPAESEREYRQS